MLLSSYNHCYNPQWFVYINKSDFSDTEKNRFFGDLRVIFGRTEKIAFSCRPGKAIFGDRKYSFFLAIKKRFFGGG